MYPGRGPSVCPLWETAENETWCGFLGGWCRSWTRGRVEKWADSSFPSGQTNKFLHCGAEGQREGTTRGSSEGGFHLWVVASNAEPQQHETLDTAAAVRGLITWCRQDRTPPPGPSPPKQKQCYYNYLNILGFLNSDCKYESLYHYLFGSLFNYNKMCCLITHIFIWSHSNDRIYTDIYTQGYGLNTFTEELPALRFKTCTFKSQFAAAGAKINVTMATTKHIQ